MGKELVEMNEVEKALSHNLREVREKKGYTLKDVVKGTGYTEVSISRWETGTRIPKATVLYTLAKFYGVSVDRFFLEIRAGGGSKKPPPLFYIGDI